MAVGLFVPILAGLFTRRPARPRRVTAIVSGVLDRRRLQLGTVARASGGLTPAMLGLLGAFPRTSSCGGGRSRLQAPSFPASSASRLPAQSGSGFPLTGANQRLPKLRLPPPAPAGSWKPEAPSEARSWKLEARSWRART